MTTADEENLIATLVAANVSAASANANTLLEMERRQTKRYASGVLRMYDALSKIPETVRSVYIDKLLDEMSHMAEAADCLLTDGG